jgi:hypothetical protein
MVEATMTKNEIVQGAYAMVQNLSDELSRLRTEERKRQHDAWIAQGGCDRCGGRGWIVTWDTLDSLSGCYAEYGACPEGDKCTAKTVGADPGYYDHKYDNLRWHKDTFVSTPAIDKAEQELKDWQETLKEAQSEARVAKGKIIKVVRGRKVPQGTTGECIWFGAGKSYSYYGAGSRVGLKEPNGTVHWTAADNVEVV